MSDYNPYERQNPYRPRPVRRRFGCLSCLPLLIVFIAVIGAALWAGWLPFASFAHTAPLSIHVTTAPTLIIKNNARNSSSLRRRDVAPIRIQAGASRDTIAIQMENMPFFGDLPVTYHQTPDLAVTFVDVTYNYKGAINIAVPTNTNIMLDSYGNGVTVTGLTSRLILSSYEGSIEVANCTLSGPSAIKSYQGSLNIHGVTLATAASFQTYQGDIRFQGRLAPRGHHSFSTYKGSVALFVPTNSAFMVDAYTYQKAINTNFTGLKPSDDGTLTGQVGVKPEAYVHLYTYENTITLTGEGKE